MAATAQAQYEATKASQREGIMQAQKGNRYLGRKPSYDARQLNLVFEMLSDGTSGTSAIAKASGLTRQTVLRIKGDPAGAQQALEAWSSA